MVLSANFVSWGAIIANLALASACGSEKILSQNFDHYTGAYQKWTKPLAKDDFPGLIFQKFDTYASVGEGNLKVMNPKGCVGTKECGLAFDVELPKLMEVTLQYRFMFSSGYGFNKGGKLPGLCSKECPSGCRQPGSDGGWSERVMWRTEAALMSYSYGADMSTDQNCGEDHEYGLSAAPGKWHSIKIHVKVNSNGKADGEHTVWLDGSQVKKRSGVMFSESSKPAEKFTFRIFHGGSSKPWASPQDQWVYIDDISISGGSCVEQLTFIEEDEVILGGGNEKKVDKKADKKIDTNVDTNVDKKVDNKVDNKEGKSQSRGSRKPRPTRTPRPTRSRNRGRRM